MIAFNIQSHEIEKAIIVLRALGYSTLALREHRDRVASMFLTPSSKLVDWSAYTWQENAELYDEKYRVTSVDKLADTLSKLHFRWN